MFRVSFEGANQFEKYITQLKNYGMSSLRIFVTKEGLEISEFVTLARDVYVNIKYNSSSAYEYVFKPPPGQESMMICVSMDVLKLALGRTNAQSHFRFSYMDPKGKYKPTQYKIEVEKFDLESMDRTEVVLQLPLLKEEDNDLIYFQPHQQVQYTFLCNEYGTFCEPIIKLAGLTSQFFSGHPFIKLQVWDDTVDHHKRKCISFKLGEEQQGDGLGTAGITIRQTVGELDNTKKRRHRNSNIKYENLPKPQKNPKSLRQEFASDHLLLAANIMSQTSGPLTLVLKEELPLTVSGLSGSNNGTVSMSIMYLTSAFVGDSDEEDGYGDDDNDEIVHSNIDTNDKHDDMIVDNDSNDSDVFDEEDIKNKPSKKVRVTNNLIDDEAVGDGNDDDDHRNEYDSEEDNNGNLKGFVVDENEEEECDDDELKI